MRALVVGGGSIGRRHLQNMRHRGIEHLAVVDLDESRTRSLNTEFAIASFSSLTAGVDFRPDFVVICTPNHLHVQQALLVASSGVDLFVEKPLAHREEGLAELCELVASNRLVSLVGCNMRFHPGPAKVKQLLMENRIGRVLFAHVYVGSYLPGWRPGTDYRSNYAARRETGGGCILDCIHEIDLCRWYLGEVSELFCLAERVSSLEIETEDFAVLICRHTCGAISEVHLDYVQRTYQRGCQMVGELGSIFWDYKSAEVRLFDGTTERWEEYAQPMEWSTNQMYLDEMQHFIDCVRKRESSVLPIGDAAELMQIVFAAKRSARQSTMTPVYQGVPA